MGLVSSNKVDVNRYALEVSVSKEEFAQAVEALLESRRLG